MSFLNTMGTRKDEGSRAPGQENQVRSMQWCSCKGPRLQSAETLTECSTEMQTQPPVLPHRGLLPPDPVHTQRSLIPSASLSLALPLNTILTQMWLISDSSPALPWHSFEMRTGYFPFIQQKTPFLLGRPQTFSWLSLQDPEHQSSEMG